MQQTQRCVTGVDPLATAPAPYTGEFGSSDFLVAPQVEAIAQELISACSEFDVLESMIDSGKFRVAYLWRKKAAKSCGKTVLGKSIKVSGYARHFSQADFVIEIAADAARFLTNYQLEAAIYHELLHIGIEYDEDEDGNETLVIRPEAHDVEMFNAEVERYGLWKNDLTEAALAFKQAPLWERNGRTAWQRSDNQATAKSDDEEPDDLPTDLFDGDQNPEPTALTIEPKVPVDKVRLLTIASDPAQAGGVEMVSLIRSGCRSADGDTVEISTSLADRWGLTPVNA